MKRIALTEAECLPDEQADALAGTLLDELSYDRLVREDCDVLKPDGSLLLAFRRRAIPAALCPVAYRSLRAAAQDTDNRGLAGGVIGSVNEIRFNPETTNVKMGRTRYRIFVSKEGRISDQNRAHKVNSGIVGFFDRAGRFPYCRQTAYTIEHRDRFEAAIPFIRAADGVFARTVPDRYAAQRAMVERTSPDFVIPGTVFTTVTVNRNWQTAVHKDQGDLKAGFGVMTALRAGSFDGCYLCFPKFRTAVDMRTRDVLLADVHEWHGNTPIVGVPGGFERISLVLYYREFMSRCGSAAEELRRAKNRRPGDPIRG